MKTKQILLLVGILIAGILIGKFAFNNDASKSTHSAETVEEHWTCSMHPQIDMPEFGSCPICGMDLILKDASADSEGTLNSFKMTKNAMALANIETIVVGKNKASNNANAALKVSGKIQANDKETALQTAHFGGRIEKLYYKSVGDYLKIGALIAKVYSPELVTAQNELIEAMNVKELQPFLYQAVRNKIKLWKISEKQIQQIERTKKVITYFNMYASTSGYIDEILVQEGTHLKEGTPMFKVSKLQTVWAVFDVYEQDVKNAQLQQEINITLNAYPDKKITSKINFINPILDAKKRTIEVRATLKNNRNFLKPGMLITGNLTLKNNAIAAKLVVPKSAILWTGKRSIVYVKTSKDEPIFELREVKLGASLKDNYEIISGLNTADEIVTNGTFTVDATAQLQGKKSMMSPKNENEEKEISEKMIEKIVVNPNFVHQLNEVFKNYIVLKNGLVVTDAKKVSEAAKTTLTSLQKVQMKLLKKPEAHAVWMQGKKEIKNTLEQIQKENDVEKQRTSFIKLSNAMVILAKTFGVHTTIYVQHCPMANNNKGADWLSYDETIKNPYYGDKMLSCGSTKQTLKKDM